MRPPLLHEDFQDIIDGMSFEIRYSDVEDNNDGTFTLFGVRKLHFIYPGLPVTIDGKTYRVKDYALVSDCFSTITLYKGTDSNGAPQVVPPSPGSFNLNKPFFCHGTPVQQENELEKIALGDRVPMIYLIEPYQVEYIEDPRSAIASIAEARVAFITESKHQDWLTSDFYHNAINPMVRLMRDFIRALIASKKFNADRLRQQVKYHARFGITIVDYGTKLNYFATDLSGTSSQMRLERLVDDLCCCDVPDPTRGASYDSAFHDSFDN